MSKVRMLFNLSTYLKEVRNTSRGSLSQPSCTVWQFDNFKMSSVTDKSPYEDSSAFLIINFLLLLSAICLRDNWMDFFEVFMGDREIKILVLPILFPPNFTSRCQICPFFVFCFILSEWDLIPGKCLGHQTLRSNRLW